MTNLLDKISHAKNLLHEAIETYAPKIAVSCSFGKDSIVVVHLARQIMKDIPVFSVLTPFKPPETFAYKDKIQKLWKLNLTVYQSSKKVDPNLHKTNPDLCCHILKVAPAQEAVKHLDAWISGLRNNEGRTRKDFTEVEKKGALVKINPILEWTELDIWRYIAINRIPVHPWYKLGYRSLGCAPCTHLVADTETERSGRWIGTSKCGGECGIHTKILKENTTIHIPTSLKKIVAIKNRYSTEKPERTIIHA